MTIWKSRRVVANREKKVQHSRPRSDMRQNCPLEKHQSIERGVGKKSMPFWLHTDALLKRE